jgi:hypothetical protein
VKMLMEQKLRSAPDEFRGVIARTRRTTRPEWTAAPLSFWCHQEVSSEIFATAAGSDPNTREGLTFSSSFCAALMTKFSLHTQPPRSESSDHEM